MKEGDYVWVKTDRSRHARVPGDVGVYVSTGKVILGDGTEMTVDEGLLEKMSPDDAHVAAVMES